MQDLPTNILTTFEAIAHAELADKSVRVNEYQKY